MFNKFSPLLAAAFAALFIFPASAPGGMMGSGMSIPGPDGGTRMTGATTYKRYTVLDPMSGNIPAWHSVVPKDWSIQGGVEWQGQSYLSPATVVIVAKGPADMAEAFACSNQMFTWTESKYGTAQEGVWQVGFMQKRYPSSYPDFLMDLFRSMRPGARNVRIVQADPNPSLRQATRKFVQTVLASAAPSGGVFTQTNGDLGGMRLEYQENGVNYEEEVLAVFASTLLDTWNMTGFRTLYWGAGPIISFRAQKGSLEKHRLEFEMFRLNTGADPRWSAALSQVTGMLINKQMDASRGWGEVGRKIRDTQHYITDDAMRQHQQRMASMDRISELQTDFILERNRFSAPDGSVISVPSKYGNAWLGSDGSVVASESRSFNPNAYSTATYTSLNPVTSGW